MKGGEHHIFLFVEEVALHLGAIFVNVEILRVEIVEFGQPLPCDAELLVLEINDFLDIRESPSEIKHVPLTLIFLPEEEVMQDELPSGQALRFLAVLILVLVILAECDQLLKGCLLLFPVIYIQY